MANSIPTWDPSEIPRGGQTLLEFDKNWYTITFWPKVLFGVCPRFSNKIWAGLDYLVIRLSWSHYENLGRRQNREGCVKSIPEGGGAEFGQGGGGLPPLSTFNL